MFAPRPEITTVIGVTTELPHESVDVRLTVVAPRVAAVPAAGLCVDVTVPHASFTVTSGTMFGSFDEAGNYVVGYPDPSEVTIVSLSAGHLPIFLFDDC